MIIATVDQDALDRALGALPMYEVLRQISDQAEKHAMYYYLEKSWGNVAEAARLAQVPRDSFWGWIQKHSIDPDVFRWARAA